MSHSYPAKLLILTLLLLLAGRVDGLMVKHDGTTIFYDDFEDDPPGTFPPTTPLIGSYHQENLDDGLLYVSTGTVAGPNPLQYTMTSGAPQGNNYAGMHRAGHPEIKTVLIDKNSGTLTYSMMLYFVPISYAFAVALEEPAGEGSDSYYICRFTVKDALGTAGMQFDPGWNWSLHSQQLLVDDWNRLEFEYEIGTTSVDVSINGITETLSCLGASSVESLNINTNDSSQQKEAHVMIDAIPQTPHNRGDVDDNGFVGADDLVTILTNWAQSGGVTWPQGDISPYNDGINTGDDFIGADDYVDVLTYWATGYLSPEPIPEPSSLGFLAGAVLLGGIIRRR